MKKENEESIEHPQCSASAKPLLIEAYMHRVHTEYDEYTNRVYILLYIQNRLHVRIYRSFLFCSYVLLSLCDGCLFQHDQRRCRTQPTLRLLLLLLYITDISRSVGQTTDDLASSGTRNQKLEVVRNVQTKQRCPRNSRSSTAPDT